jgi:transcriptional regulator with XRE-family HTH domain
MTFGERVRELRQAKDWSLRELAAKVDVGFTYLSRVENERLNFGDYPSDALIHRLADALQTDEEELLILAKRVPERIRNRVLQRPDVFGALAECDDKTLDKLLDEIGKTPKPRKGRGGNKCDDLQH